jgi:hypothetical protein
MSLADHALLLVSHDDDANDRNDLVLHLHAAAAIPKSSAMVLKLAGCCR